MGVLFCNKYFYSTYFEFISLSLVLDLFKVQTCKVLIFPYIVKRSAIFHKFQYIVLLFLLFEIFYFHFNLFSAPYYLEVFCTVSKYGGGGGFKIYATVFQCNSTIVRKTLWFPWLLVEIRSGSFFMAYMGHLGEFTICTQKINFVVIRCGIL